MKGWRRARGERNAHEVRPWAMRGTEVPTLEPIWPRDGRTVDVDVDVDVNFYVVVDVEVPLCPFFGTRLDPLSFVLKFAAG